MNCTSPSIVIQSDDVAFVGCNRKDLCKSSLCGQKMSKNICNIKPNWVMCHANEW